MDIVSVRYIVDELLLNAPGAGGAGRAGGTPEPGGWNRFQLTGPDLGTRLARLQDAGVDVRSGIVSGHGGDQALIRDPAGNLVELFQPAPEAGHE